MGNFHLGFLVEWANGEVSELIDTVCTCGKVENTDLDLCFARTCPVFKTWYHCRL